MEFNTVLIILISILVICWLATPFSDDDDDDDD